VKDFFSLLGLPRKFTLDLQQLETAFRQVQSQVHPDRFVTATDAEKRVAMQYAAQVNQAYQTLKSPLQRAQYLCELQGVDLQVESNTAMPAEFLMQQMEWREALQAARETGDKTTLQNLEKELAAATQTLGTEVTEKLDQQQNVVAAAAAVRRWLFIEKCTVEIHHALETL
jgi:molecular chaperone HscB